MASNQRENQRREKERRKDIKTKRIIWSVLAVIIVALIIMKVCEIDFKAIKNRYTDANGKFTVSMTTDEDAYPFQLDSSSNVRVDVVNDKLNVLTESSVSVINPSNAEVLYSFSHGYANPMINYNGNYFCLIDQGGSRLRLDTNSDNLYELKQINPVLNADVAKNGTVIYATRGTESKSTLIVVNKSLKNLMTLDINDGYVVDVAIDDSGKKCAYATVNSADAKLITTIHTIDVGDDEDKAKFDFPDSNVLDLNYSSSCLYFVSDNMVSVFTSQKKHKDTFKAGTINTNCFTYTKSGLLVINYSDYSESIDSTIAYVGNNGKVKTSIPIKNRVKYLSASSNEVAVLTSDKILKYSLTNGKMKKSIPCNESIKSVNNISSKMFTHRGQILDVID